MTGTDWIMFVVAAALVFFAGPVWSYMCAKMATYGFLMGRYRFEQDHPNQSEDVDNGNAT